MIDIGVNLLHPQFDPDRQAVINRAATSGITGMLITATDLDTTRAAINFCEAHPGSSPVLASTAGVHPHYAKDAKDAEEDLTETLRELAHSPHVRAIGETGLDFNRNYSPPDIQLRVFEQQLCLAADLALPVFVHDRDSDGAVFQALKKHAHQLPNMVVHCFTGTASELNHYLDLGCAIGITGWICDQRRGGSLREMVDAIPLDRLLIETDAPFLMPQNVPKDWQKVNAPGASRRRNEPALLPWVASAVAEATGTPLVDIIEATRSNAARIFGPDLVH